MALQNEGSVEIDRPIHEVFRLTNEDVAKWSIVVDESELLDGTEKGVGTRFRSVTEDHGKRMEFQGIVTAYDPPYASAVKLTGDMFDIEAAYSFEDLGQRTKVTPPSNSRAPPRPPSDARLLGLSRSSRLVRCASSLATRSFSAAISRSLVSSSMMLV